MSRPKGSSDTGIILKLASPSGMPISVTHKSTPLTRWPSASHQPHSTIHNTFPIAEPAPASVRRTTVRPNGHRAYSPIRTAATPKGMVTIRTKQIRAANA